MSNQVYDHVKQFKRLHVGIRVENPNFVCYPEMPYNMKVLLSGITRLSIKRKRYKKKVDDL